MQPSEEDFKEWQGHPVTEWVMRVMTEYADNQKDIWAAAAWESGDAAQEVLNEARVRADCYREIPNTKYEDWTAIDDPEN